MLFNANANLYPKITNKCRQFNYGTSHYPLPALTWAYRHLSRDAL
jgi:hypothetical protein